MRSIQMIVLSIILLFGIRVSFGMEKKNNKPVPSDFAFNRLYQEIHWHLRDLSGAKIVKISKEKCDDYIIYLAFFNNNEDKIEATYFRNESRSVRYDTKCITASGVVIPMNHTYYWELRGLYKNLPKNS